MEDYALVEEEYSIESCDLFGEEFGERADDCGYNPDRSNPFSEYLKKLVADLGQDNPGYEGILELQSINNRDDFFDRVEGKMPG